MFSWTKRNHGLGKRTRETKIFANLNSECPTELRGINARQIEGRDQMAKIEERIAKFTDHSYGTWRRQALWKSPFEIKDAEGVYMFDKAGKRYLDFLSQQVCCNLGHKNRVIIEAIIKQAEKLPYAAPGFMTKAGEQAVEALLTVMPQELVKFFFSTSGTEANETALKILRTYKSPNYKVISRYHSYHGATIGSINLTGDTRRWDAERVRCTVDGVRFAPDVYCYRCPFGLEYPECDIRCARYIDYMIKEEGNVAAIMVEPVVGTNGRIVPPPEYFPILKEICKQNGVLLVVDEVMSGWFRTGKPFAIQNWNIVPDILTTAKGCTGAYTPAGVVATSKEIADFFEEVTFVPRLYLCVPSSCIVGYSCSHKRIQKTHGLRAT